jgi:hypothetical protein
MGKATFVQDVSFSEIEEVLLAMNRVEFEPSAKAQPRPSV